MLFPGRALSASAAASEIATPPIAKLFAFRCPPNVGDVSSTISPNAVVRIILPGTVVTSTLIVSVLLSSSALLDAIVEKITSVPVAFVVSILLD